MGEEDLKVNSKVRKILVEAGLDTSVVALRTTSGAVTIHGELRKFSGQKLNDSRITKLLTILETAILNSKGVKRVTFSIEMWRKRKGKWIRQEE